MTFRERVPAASLPWKRIVGTSLLIVVAVSPGHAARPLNTEDVAVVQDKGCQVESWVDRYEHAATGWFVPACNFGFDTEWQAGFARTRADGESRFSDAYAQAKMVLRALTDAEPWGVGLVVGVNRHPLNAVHRGWDHPYAIAAFTQGICHTPFVVHANAGWTREREAQRDLTLWAAAVEWGVTEHAALLAEAWGQNSDKPFVRVGGRWSAIPHHLDVDLSWAARPGGTSAERLVSLGVTWQLGAFLP
jgi:hypothetical protein